MTLPGLLPLLVDGRVDSVRGLMVEARCDAIVVTDPVDIRWCTGFTGSAGVLLISDSTSILITDSRYGDQAPAELLRSSCDTEVEISRSPVEVGARHLDGAGTVGLEAESVTWAQHTAWSAAVEADLVATNSLIKRLRSIKNEAEIQRIELAAGMVDKALAEVVEMIRPGTSERDLAEAIDQGMRQSGADGPAYDTIVAGGPNSALPHATPGDREFRSGDLLVIDAGAMVDGYRSDMTRTFLVSNECNDPRGEEILEVVLKAQKAGVARVSGGVTAGDVDLACREVVEAAGWGELFVHGSGHGVGLDIHELPAVRTGNADILQPGHVLTVEPGIYVAGMGGARIEDTVVVTQDGSRVITRYPKTIDD